MIFQLDRLLGDVRVCLGENRVSTSLLLSGDIDTLSKDELIRSKVLEGVRRVHEVAPYYLLECGHNFGDAIYWADQESGWVLLPDDFLRLVMFEMDDWERPVYSAISIDDPEYAKQRSRIKGIRGTCQKPVCAIGVRPEGRVLEFYSCKSRSAQVSRAIYIPYPEIDSDNGIDISERCYDAVVYMVGGLTLISEGDATKGGALLELSKSNLG